MSEAQRFAPKNGKKALLFDFGGTLAFLDYVLLAAEFSTPSRKLHPTELERAEYRGRKELDCCLMGPRGNGLDHAYALLFRAWMEAAGIPAEEVEAHGERFRAIHREATLWRVVRPGTFEALEKLKSAGIRLGIVSNAEGQVADDAKRFGLAPYFDVIIDSHLVGVAKPDPRIFRIAMEQMDIGPDETLYAGDIYSIDMLGAKAAGIDGRLIDQLDLYDWVEHTRIRGVHEFHPLD